MIERKEREYLHNVKALLSRQSGVTFNEDSVMSWQVLTPVGVGSDTFLMHAPKTTRVTR
jgi:hypothetical protein